MRTLLHSVVAVIFSSILFWGCSGEEPSKPLGTGAVVVKKPVSKPLNKTEAEVSTIVKDANPAAAAMPPIAEEKVAPAAAQTEAAAGQAKPPEQPVQKAEAPKKRDCKTSTESEEAKDCYVVKKGETLAGVAGKKDIYGDRLKWAILYRLNAPTLNPLPAEHLPDFPLPDGVKLKIVTREEIAGNLEKRAGNIWVVNVLSAVTNAEVIPAVITLVKNDYTVYVTAARVNDKDWMRVRVGFFRNKEEAESEGKKIQGILSLQDSWVTKLTKTEFKEFAGY